MGTATSQFTSIDEYIDSFPEEVGARLRAVRQAMREEVPDAEEAIKYHMPTFVFHGNLVLFAAWKKHIALYPVTTEMERAIPELLTYTTSGKGTIQFPHHEPLPLPLIRRIVAFRVAEHMEKIDQLQA
jgi:uncharacterized protein YdhG (YjbR/CyaY superfamily)